MNWNLAAKLIAGDGRSSDNFGISVSLSGNRALVGAYGDDDHGTVSGSAYIINSPPQFNVNVTVTGLAATNSISFANGGDTAIFTTNETQTISILDDGSTFNVAFDLSDLACAFASFGLVPVGLKGSKYFFIISSIFLSLSCCLSVSNITLK